MWLLNRLEKPSKIEMKKFKNLYYKYYTSCTEDTWMNMNKQNKKIIKEIIKENSEITEKNFYKKIGECSSWVCRKIFSIETLENRCKHRCKLCWQFYCKGCLEKLFFDCGKNEIQKVCLCCIVNDSWKW